MNPEDPAPTPDPVMRFWDYFATGAFIWLLFAILVTFALALMNTYPYVLLAVLLFLLGYVIWKRKSR